MDRRRMRRINELIKQTIGKIITEGRLKTSFAGLLTITNVRVSSDLSVAHINYTVMGNDEETAQKFLNRSRYEITSLLAEKARLRMLPKLHFYPDEVQKNANRIEELIREINRD